MPPRRVDSSSANAVLGKYDAVVFDCDGVVWLQEKAVPGAIEMVQHLQKIGKLTFFNTNNSAEDRENFKKKFERVGFRGITTDMLQSSASACADYLVENGFKGKKVYVVGESGLAKELAAAGMHCIGTTPDGNEDGMDERKRSVRHRQMQEEPIDPDVAAVVVGMDWRMCYYKIGYASFLVQRGAAFIVTNADRSAPAPGGRRLPAAGCIVAAVEMTSERKPDIITGKPNPTALLHLMKQRGLDPSRVLMVGDRLDTDIAFGNSAGTDTMLVLSGVTSAEQALAAPPATSPTYIADSVAVFNEVKARL